MAEAVKAAQLSSAMVGLYLAGWRGRFVLDDKGCEGSPAWVQTVQAARRAVSAAVRDLAGCGIHAQIRVGRLDWQHIRL